VNRQAEEQDERNPGQCLHYFALRSADKCDGDKKQNPEQYHNTDQRRIVDGRRQDLPMVVVKTRGWYQQRAPRRNKTKIRERQPNCQVPYFVAVGHHTSVS